MLLKLLILTDVLNTDELYIATEDCSEYEEFKGKYDKGKMMEKYGDREVVAITPYAGGLEIALKKEETR